MSSQRFTKYSTTGKGIAIFQLPVFGLLAVVLLLGACAMQPELSSREIDDLVQQAIAAGRAHREVPGQLTIDDV